MSIWAGPFTLEELNRTHEHTLAAYIGIVITAFGDDWLQATMPVDERTHQPMGVLHGGASVALAESVGSVAANLCVDPAQFRCMGQEINANHIRPATRGLVTGTARPLHIGRTSQVWGIDITNEANKRVCISRLTMAVIPVR